MSNNDGDEGLGIGLFAIGAAVLIASGWFTVSDGELPPWAKYVGLALALVLFYASRRLRQAPSDRALEEHHRDEHPA